MQLGPYELVRMIGAGGMGEVWAAHRIGASEHEVLAVKCLPERLADVPAFRQILLEEARLAMLLRHPNIVHVFDASEVGGYAYIAMEFVHGLDLARLRKHMAETGERLSAPVIAYIIGQILTGLDYAHNLVHDAELLSLVHRDISPHNVMLSVDGEVKLTDFGVARLSSEDTSGTHVKGKARYMPPEQLRGESRSPTVDLFAAGAVLHEMLDGSVFRGAGIDDARLLGMAVNGDVPAPKYPHEIPRALERLRRGLLAPDRRQRLRSSAEALELLDSWKGYRDASSDVAQIVMRYLERQTGLAQQPTQTGLAHQATFLHTNEIRVEESDDFLAFDRPPDESMLSAAFEQPSTSGARASDARRGDDVGHPHDDDRRGIDQDGFVIDDPPSQPSRPITGAQPRLATGGHRGVEALDPSSLELDVPGGRARLELGPIDRPRTTSHHVVVPKRRTGAVLLWIMSGVAGLGLAGYGTIALIEALDARGNDQHESAPTDTFGLRKARVLGDGSPSHAGFRHRRMDKLAADDILYEYVSSPSADAAKPLAALAAGEAEFALMRLDQLLRVSAQTMAGAKIVALVAVSDGADGLVLDSVEHPTLRSLADLAKLARKLDLAPVLAATDADPGAYLELRLDSLLTALDQPALERAEQAADPQAVYDALAAAADDEAPVVAAMLSEPWLSRAREAGMTVAVSTAELPTAVIHVLVASERALSSDPAFVSTVVGRYYEVVHAQHTDPAEHEPLIQQVVTSSGLSAAEASAALLGLCRPDAAGAQLWLNPGGDHGALLAEAVDATWSSLRARDQVTGSAPSLETLLDARAVAAAAAAKVEIPHTCVPDSTASSRTDKSIEQPLGPLELPGTDAPWFEPSEAALSSDHAADIDELSARLRSFNPASVTAVVTGYGDARGDKSRALGQQRGRALVDALRAAGVTMPLEPRGASSNAAPPTQLRVSLAWISDE
ncbi:protein kinase domain-containing protein [Enhygromyxa salina]|uniref:non-specific serine/threonine protein kinase n=1 Tax=Enhygromyxa salina TaxID=215803 RepID=A0A2S9YYD6_9BACT|nr:protein kinase [Enhygromyxa salina]PRQ10103.1 Serine/threonine-protein kinase pkn6 [Enhygromyxa salina]